MLPLACNNENLKMVTLLQRHGAEFERHHFKNVVLSGSKELISEFVNKNWDDDEEVLHGFIDLTFTFYSFIMLIKGRTGIWSFCCYNQDCFHILIGYVFLATVIG